ncbi:MAG: hypothetical protein P8N09_13125 [Planctomycetota bacterium]|jgi:hypothetical protein|nr:hypothetical protein [Planctomycetota bacterium]
MKSTMLSLLKFECDNSKCLYECWVNRNNNMLTHYSADMSALLDWVCPDCKEGQLRYSPANARFEYELRKHSKQAELEMDQAEQAEGNMQG